MKTQYLAFALLAFTACKKSDAASNAVPCAPAATELAKQLGDANGYNMDLTKPETKALIAKAKQSLAGKQIAFSNCAFTGQGNDVVRFGAAKDGADLECHLAGGEASVTEFRHAAMDLEMAKLKLDVTGKITAKGDELELTGCTIHPHE